MNARQSRAVTASLLLTVTSVAHAAEQTLPPVPYVPWDSLRGGRWTQISENPAHLYTVNGMAYTLAFKAPKADGAARGMQAFRFVVDGNEVGRYETDRPTGQFAVFNGGNNNTYQDVILLVAVCAPSLPRDWTLALHARRGNGATEDIVLHGPNDFVAYESDPNRLATGRPSGYLLTTDPAREEIAYGFARGLVCLYGFFDVNLKPGALLPLAYEANDLGESLVFSVYGATRDKKGRWCIAHTNRAVPDRRDPEATLSSIGLIPTQDRADLDQDGHVNLRDFARWAVAWSTGSAADLDRNGRWNAVDLRRWTWSYAEGGLAPDPAGD